MAANFTLDEASEQLIRTLVSSGRYASASDVVRDGLRLVEEREQTRAATLAALRTDIQAGLDSGPPEIHDMAAVKAEARARRTSRKQP
ncbi:type II toxin-antitoxin system ParD family antitoxin [Methylobacterium oryzihabitans]|uniref:Type II toxin-antitoxin system ParD family antitoxin n=2 Tax=Methylobacterium oryzihabitans TaxID=2499852 RepID=A0A437P3Z2_9HYPH|nr:type II toxin-antitoxin system ParD family antitoxin [Methylobacterium oryzihabitans]